MNNIWNGLKVGDVIETRSGHRFKLCESQFCIDCSPFVNKKFYGKHLKWIGKSGAAVGVYNEDEPFGYELLDINEYKKVL